MELEDYKGYNCTLEWQEEYRVWYGKLDILRDVIAVKGQTKQDLEKDLKEAIDDYLEFCAEQGKEPEKPFKQIEGELKSVEDSTIRLPKYRGYEATVGWSDEDEVFYGQVIISKGLWSLEGNSIKEITEDFKEMVDEIVEGVNK